MRTGVERMATHSAMLPETSSPSTWRQASGSMAPGVVADAAGAVVTVRDAPVVAVAPLTQVLGSDPNRTERARRASTASSKGTRFPAIS